MLKRLIVGIVMIKPKPLVLFIYVSKNVWTVWIKVRISAKERKGGKVERAETNFQAAKRLSNCYGLELEGFSQRRIKRQYNNIVAGFLTIEP